MIISTNLHADKPISGSHYWREGTWWVSSLLDLKECADTSRETDLKIARFIPCRPFRVITRIWNSTEKHAVSYCTSHSVSVIWGNVRASKVVQDHLLHQLKLLSILQKQLPGLNTRSSNRYPRDLEGQGWMHHIYLEVIHKHNQCWYYKPVWIFTGKAPDLLPPYIFIYN